MNSPKLHNVALRAWSDVEIARVGHWLPHRRFSSAAKVIDHPNNVHPFAKQACSSARGPLVSCNGVAYGWSPRYVINRKRSTTISEGHTPPALVAYDNVQLYIAHLFCLWPRRYQCLCVIFNRLDPFTTLTVKVAEDWFANGWKWPYIKWLVTCLLIETRWI